MRSSDRYFASGKRLKERTLTRFQDRVKAEVRLYAVFFYYSAAESIVRESDVIFCGVRRFYMVI